MQIQKLIEVLLAALKLLTNSKSTHINSLSEGTKAATLYFKIESHLDFDKSRKLPSALAIAFYQHLTRGHIALWE